MAVCRRCHYGYVSCWGKECDSCGEASATESEHIAEAERLSADQRILVLEQRILLLEAEVARLAKLCGIGGV